MDIRKTLAGLHGQPSYEAVYNLFEVLNIPLQRYSTDAYTPDEFFQNNVAVYDSIDTLYAAGLVHDRIFDNADLQDELEPEQVKYKGLGVFAVNLSIQNPSRSVLTEITRQVNRRSKGLPVVVIFFYEKDKEPHLAIANAERTNYKLTTLEGEKVGKVSVLRDISLLNLHAGHERILLDLQIKRNGKGAVNTFEGLYAYWRGVFDVSVLNKKFYQELSNWYFWAIREVTFPGEPLRIDYPKEEDYLEAVKEHNGKNVIRLLTRVLFVWFIKEKKLVPESIFDKSLIAERYIDNFVPEKPASQFATAKHDSRYYRAVLQNLFFAILNQEQGKREFRKRGQHQNVTNLMRYEDYLKDPDAFLKELDSSVPFLNGGLFECLDKPHTELKGKNGGDVIVYTDGFSDRDDNVVRVPDFLFFDSDETLDLSKDYGVETYKTAKTRGLFEILKAYKFTLTENTPVDEEVALDPELLGKVFENLLASYNPETKTTARNQTGSFYTPREIVNYMVDESLIAYLKNALEVTDQKKEQLDEQLHKLASFDPGNPFEENQKLTRQIIEALSNCKILDPACGSGAFPMGILQKMVHMLQKLDQQNKIWKEVQVAKALDETKEAFEMNNKDERNARLEEISNAFDESTNNPDYARKLFLIENCIYGVDIQPIATQISKLRFFISLVVDQKVNQGKNFGIRPLPNLETRFVTANTLIGIDKPSNQTSLFSTEKVKALEKELKKVRHLLFSAKTKETKLKYRAADERLRKEIAYELIINGWANDTAEKLARWDPYEQNTSSPFFDPEWMFDICNSFNILIGNPPYIDSEGMIASGNEWLRELISNSYKLTKGNWDIYIAFFEKSFSLLDEFGILSFITPDKWLTKPFGTDLRKFSLPFLHKLLRSGRDVFESAGVDSIVTVFNKEPSKYFDYLDMFEGGITNVSSVNKEIFQPPYQLDIVFSPYIKLLIEITNSHSSLKVNFKQECENACATSDCYILKEILENSEDVPEDVLHYKVINTGTIGRYISRWGKKEMTYLKDKYIHPIVRYDSFHETFNNSYATKAKSPKIIIKGLTLLDSTIDYSGSVIPGKSTLIIKSSDNNQLKVLAAIINSKVASFYIKQRYSASSYNTGVNFTKDMISNLPVPVIDDKKGQVIYLLVDMICSTDDLMSIKILDYILDSFVLQLYFEEHMKDINVDIIERINEDIYNSMEGRYFETLSDAEKENIVNQLTMTWSDPNNEVVTRMAQFKEKSPDILKPIMES
jgi:hypothetical protein